MIAIWNTYSLLFNLTLIDNYDLQFRIYITRNLNLYIKQVNTIVLHDTLYGNFVTYMTSYVSYVMYDICVYSIL